MSPPILTRERLLEVLEYDPETGEWRWRVARRGHREGAVAGFIHEDGYRQIMIDGRNYVSSRLAVFYTTGEWPTDQVDHKDRDPSNDRWLNLRPATQSQNNANTIRPRRVHPELPRGVYPNRGRFRAMVKHQRKTIQLGTYDTLEEARAAYRKAAIALHGEFALSTTYATPVAEAVAS
jgi:hypothetical protein